MDVPADEQGGPVPRLGSSFGRYRIESILGRGGMGVVFRATDLQLGRTVALKVLDAGLADDAAFRRRFERESRLAASIDHPAILPIYDAGAVGSTLFIAMRLVTGGDLATALRRDAPLGFGRTRAIAERIAAALDAAHALGLVHRDVKAANILLERLDAEELAYLSDFGISRSRHEQRTTQVTAFAGSLATMAPEAIEGAEITPAADQYALACVVYECLTGRAPFSGATDAAFLYAHLVGEVPSVGAHPPDLDDPDTVAAVDAVLRRAFAKRPGDRWPDCRTFVAALAQAAHDLPADRPPAPARTVDRRPEDTRRPRPRATTRGRRRWVVGAVAGGVVLLGLGLLATRGERPPGTAALPSATLPATPSPAPASASPAPDGSRPAASPVPPDDHPPGPPGSLQDLPGIIVFSGMGDASDSLDLFRIRPDGGDLESITTEPTDETMPALSPGGRWVAYAVGKPGKRDVWLADLTTGERAPLVATPADEFDPAWAADGRRIAFTRTDTGGSDIWQLALDGAQPGEASPLVVHAGEDSQPSWHPDGTHLAFVSDRDGVPAVLVAPIDDPASAARISAGDHAEGWPRWTPDGRLLLSRDAGGDLDVFSVSDALTSPVMDQLTTSNLMDWGASPSVEGAAFVHASGDLIDGDAYADLLLRWADGGPATPLVTRNAFPQDPTWGPEP